MYRQGISDYFGLCKTIFLSRIAFWPADKFIGFEASFLAPALEQFSWHKNSAWFISKHTPT